MTVHTATDDRPEEAVVWLSYDQISSFASRISQFAENTAAGKPKQLALVANIEQIHRALLENLWQEEVPLPTGPERVWWELWLDPDLSGPDSDRTLREFARLRGWQVGDYSVAIGGKIVVDVEAFPESLSELLATNTCPVEVRKPSFVADLHECEQQFQREIALDLASRVNAAPPGAPVVCVLDTGVYQEHPLLKGPLAGRAYSALPNVTPDDRHGHGTEMAGLAVYGDLAGPLGGAGPISLTHGFESVKILRQQGEPETSRRTYAEVTANGVAIAETGQEGQPDARVFSMAVTRESVPPENGVDGRATLWSATLDALAAGTSVAVHDDRVDLIDAPDSSRSRLIVVSAGNVRDAIPADMRGEDGHLDHLNLCDLSRIEEPAQAWNVLCVGAYTELTEVPQHQSFAGFRPVAAGGELSPFSRTSVALTGSVAIKPDIVLEGGNQLVDATETQFQVHEVVSVTTTRRNEFDLLTTANATSAATAQAARLAALAYATYPGLRPETVRGLLVHEARWTEAMSRGMYKRTGKPAMSKQQLLATVLQRYGWGVPTEERVLSSALNAVTLIVQGELTPFKREGGSIRLAELNLHELPWPLEQLRDLGETNVELRVTLSYMIEPNPARRGMRGVYTYPSHRLRFGIKGPRESVDAFERRVTEEAEAETDGRTQVKPFESDDHWLLGTNARKRGSLHADIWRGSAVDLASCGVLAVYPAGGWWKSHARSDRIGLPVPYALLVSLATPEVESDIYSPIAVKLGVPVPISGQSRIDVTTPVQMELGW